MYQNSESAKIELIKLLQNAYSGEMAAAFAYRGHAQASKDPTEKSEILKIETDEWEHRKCLGQMLSLLGSRPRISREILMGLVGSCIFLFCRLGGWLNFFNFGWFMSMYGAGKLEQGNIMEYKVAADFAIDCGEGRFVDDLIHMAEVEWDHELYFRTKAMTSNWSKYLKIWEVPRPRNLIRQSINLKKN